MLRLPWVDSQVGRLQHWLQGMNRVVLAIVGLPIAILVIAGTIAVVILGLLLGLILLGFKMLRWFVRLVLRTDAKPRSVADGRQNVRVLRRDQVRIDGRVIDAQVVH